MKNIIQFALILTMFCAGTAVQAQEAHNDAPAESGGPAAPAAMSTGEVLKVDKPAGKIVLRHGPLVNLGMGGMTMPFSVGDPAMLEQVKPGDKVRFIAADPDDTLTIVKLEIAAGNPARE